MKTLEEPRPFCPPFLLPLSRLSRRRHALRVRSINNSFFLRERESQRECFLSRNSLFAQQPKREPERDQIFLSAHQKAQKSSSFHQNGERSLCFFHFL